MNQIEQLNATLNRGTFSKEELSLLKLLVLENLSNYDDLNVNESGNIYRMLQQLIGTFRGTIYDRICIRN